MNCNLGHIESIAALDLRYDINAEIHIQSLSAMINEILIARKLIAHLRREGFSKLSHESEFESASERTDLNLLSWKSGHK